MAHVLRSAHATMRTQVPLSCGDLYSFSVYERMAAVIRRVVLGRRAEKQLRILPRHVAAKLLEWIDTVEEESLEEARKIPGYHDEPLRGEREGQRSIRLSRAYRAIYLVVGSATVRIEEVSKHGY